MGARWLYVDFLVGATNKEGTIGRLEAAESSAVGENVEIAGDSSVGEDVDFAGNSVVGKCNLLIE